VLPYPPQADHPQTTSQLAGTVALRDRRGTYPSLVPVNHYVYFELSAERCRRKPGIKAGVP
jgi:hypothetical protein